MSIVPSTPENPEDAASPETEPEEFAIPDPYDPDLSDDESDDEDAPPALLPRKIDIGANLRQMVTTAMAHPDWCVLILCFVSALWLPVRWCVTEDHIWANFNSELIFQIFVPLAIFLLYWQDRAKLAGRWEGIQFYYSENNRRRRGSPIPLILGCALLLFAHLVHIAGAAFLALMVIAGGIALRLYGPRMFRYLIRPLWFMLLMIPWPGTIVTGFDNILRMGMAVATTLVLHLLKQPATSYGWVINLGDRSADIPKEACGLNILLFTMFAALFVSFLRRQKLAPTIFLIALGALTALLANLARVVIGALLLRSNEGTGMQVFMASQFFLLPVTLGLALLIERASLPLQKWLARRFKKVGKVAAKSTLATDRLLSSDAAQTVSKGVRRAGQASTTATEQAIDSVTKGIGKAIGLDKKKRKRGNWER